MFRKQGHSRDWLQPLLNADRAFSCALRGEAEPLSACFAFENYKQVWEIGGVVTQPPHRGQGLGSRIVRAALGELTRRGLLPRYQVREDNAPSIELARSIGMTPFLNLTHYTHAPFGTYASDVRI